MSTDSAITGNSHSEDSSRSQKSLCRRLLDEEIRDVTSADLWRAAVAEFVGCVFLCFFGIGMTVHDENEAGPPLLQSALGVGFLLAVLISALTTVSGGHVNPAISIGFAVLREITFVRFLIYVVFQSAGAIAGTALVKAIIPESYRGDIGLIQPAQEATTEQALVSEMMITFFLLFVTMALVDKGRSDLQGSIPFIVGITVTVNILYGAGVSGGCMNPARNLGPAVILGDFSYQWIYWVGPLTGAAVGALGYGKIFSTSSPLASIRQCCRHRSDDVIARL